MRFAILPVGLPRALSGGLIGSCEVGGQLERLDWQLGMLYEQLGRALIPETVAATNFYN